MLSGACWGVIFLAPVAAKGFSPLELSAGRYFAYGCISAILIFRRWRAVRPTLSRAHWIALFWLSLGGNILYYLLLASAVRGAGIAESTLVMGFLPVLVAIAGRNASHRMPATRLVAASSCALGGVALITLQLAQSETQAAPSPLWGLASAVGALLSWTAYAVGNSRWLKATTGIGAHDWSLLIGVVTGAQALLLIAPALLSDPVRHSTEDWWQFGAVVFMLALVASIVGNFFWNLASRLLPVTMLGQMIVFETLFALLYGFLWERRLPTVLEAVASFLLIAGIGIAATFRPRHVLDCPTQAGRARAGTSNNA